MPLGQSVYILMKGTIVVERANEDGVQIEGKTVIGGDILDPSYFPETYCATETPATFVRLSKFDYDQSVLYAAKKEQVVSMQLLMAAPFFATLTEVKLRRVCALFREQSFPSGTVVYRFNEPAEAMYIIREGEVSLQYPVSVNQTNKWPVGDKEWEVDQTRLKYNLQMKVCRRGDCFGASELIDSRHRAMTAVALTNVFAYCLDTEEMQRVFTKKEMDGLKDIELINMPSKKKLEEKVLKQLKADKTKQETLVGVVQVDAHNLNARESFLSKRTKKMKNWVENLSLRTQEESRKSRRSVVSIHHKRLLVGPAGLSNSSSSSSLDN